MKQESAKKSQQAKRVLCVLSQEQWREYQQDFERMRLPGLDFVLQSSPERALDQVAVVKPSLVIVGMTIGVMEGLEFLALLLRRYKGFDQNVVVLPNKGDPFPPMLQRRDPKTGRSTTEEIDEAAIAALLGSLAPLPSSMAARELPSEMRGDQAKEGELHDWESSFEGSLHDSAQDIPVPPKAAKKPSPKEGAPAPVATPPAAAAAFAVPQASPPPAAEHIVEDRAVVGLQAGLREAEPSSRGKWLLVVGAVAVVGVAAAGYLVLGGGDGAQDEAKSLVAKKAAPEPAKAAADAADAADEKQGVDMPVDAKQEADTAAAAPPGDEPSEVGSTSAEAPPSDSSEVPGADAKQPADAGEPAFDTRQINSLPLRFAQGSARYDVADADALGALIDTFRAALERDPNARLEVGGHASSEGSAIANRVLGRRRAASVRTHLVSRGISASRIVVRSYGADIPAVDPALAGAVEKNRRVTLKLID